MKRFPGEAISERPMECQTDCGWFDDVRRVNGFIDLRRYEDDKTVLKNPHKGWFWHFIDNGLRSPIYRNRTEAGDHAEYFPGMNHLYLRFDWSDVEKEEDVYDFGFLDDIMDEWSEYGYRFQLRVVCYESSRGMDFATPEYVFKNGARCYKIPDRNYQPDYADEYFLSRVDKFLSKLGEKYNNDDRIELIDIGTYGTWGEGHTVEGENAVYPVETIKKHIDMHIKHFPDKFVICNDDHIVGRIAHGGCQEILDYAYERGLGVQDDSICCDYYSVVNGYDTMRATWAFRKLADNAPSVIEFAHYGYIHPQFEDFYRNGLTIVECLKNSKATFAGFHGYPDVFYESDRWLAEYCANRLGYWYFVPCAVVPELTASAHNRVSVTFRNKGWSKAYHEKRIVFAVTGEDGKVYKSETGKRIDALDTEEEAVFTLNLDLRNVPGGEYSVCLGVFEGDTPIKLALKDEIKRGDFYEIAKRTVRAL